MMKINKPNDYTDCLKKYKNHERLEYLFILLHFFRQQKKLYLDSNLYKLIANQMNINTKTSKNLLNTLKDNNLIEIDKNNQIILNSFHNSNKKYKEKIETERSIKDSFEKSEIKQTHDRSDIKMLCLNSDTEEAFLKFIDNKKQENPEFNMNYKVYKKELDLFIKARYDHNDITNFWIERRPNTNLLKYKFLEDGMQLDLDEFLLINNIGEALTLENNKEVKEKKYNEHEQFVINLAKGKLFYDRTYNLLIQNNDFEYLNELLDEGLKLIDKNEAYTNYDWQKK